MRDTVISQRSSEEILEDVGALLTGHFLLTSGLHSNRYIQGQRVLQYPRHAGILAQRLADEVLAAGLKPTVVIGPALGAIHWEVFVATALDKRSQEPLRAMFAERTVESQIDPNGFALRRGMQISAEDRVLIVEDVTTTGGSALKVVKLVQELGAQPLAVGAIVDRSGTTLDFGVPFFKLLTLTLNTYNPAECPLCKDGSVAIKPGSSKN
jgi:orotate phosphoribosyltransferase